jgi:heptosyltransferase II
VVLATAAVEAIAAETPRAEVHVLTKPPFAEVFRGNPHVRRILPWEAGQGLLGLARTVREGGYEWVVDLHGNLRTRLLRVLVRGPRWSRYDKGGLGRRLAVVLRRPGLLPENHVVDRYLAALRPLGVSGRRRLPRLYPDAADRARAEALLREVGWDGAERLIALAPGARWATKRWPAERWEAVCARLAREGIGFPILLGGPEDRGLCRKVLRASEGRGGEVAGRTSPLETGAVLERCAALVTNDSAPLHLAVAVGTPVVALFGPTVRGFGFYPLGPQDAVLEQELACRPCSLHGGEHCPLRHHRCLVEVSAGAVLEAVAGLIRRADQGCGTCERSPC